MTSRTLALWLAALAVAAVLPAANAQRGNAEVYRTAIGNITGWILNDGPFAFPVDADAQQPNRLAFILNQTLPTLNAALADLHRPPDNVKFFANVLLLQVDGRRVLIDTGTGGTYFPDTARLFENLAGVGLTAERVDFVILTHVHPDHYGGLVDVNGSLNFPNAAYFVSEAEFDFWMTNGLDTAAEAALRAIENRTTLVKADGEMLLPGIRAVFTPGHTPGHMAIEVDGGAGAKLFCPGDVVHNELVMAHPGWELFVDHDLAGGIEARRALLARLSSRRERTLVYHASFPGLGHINAMPADTENGAEESYAWVPELYEF